MPEKSHASSVNGAGYAGSNFASSVSSIAPPMHLNDFPFDVWLPVMGPYNGDDLHTNSDELNQICL